MLLKAAAPFTDLEAEPHTDVFQQGQAVQGATVLRDDRGCLERLPDRHVVVHLWGRQVWRKG